MRSFSRSATPNGFRTLDYPRSGLSFRAPRNWSVISESSPLVTVVTSGAAVVVLWRYPKGVSPAAGLSDLARDRSALIASARARDQGLQLLGSKLTTVDGASAIELDAIERIDGQLRRVRSTHIFSAHAEIVLETYAPVASFASVDRAVFSPLGSSIKLTEPG